jgi:transcriptional regulator with XRE-family HTH domain
MTRTTPAYLAPHGQRLEQVRRLYGLTREQVANRAGVTVLTVARLERQRRPSRRHRAEALLVAAFARSDCRGPADGGATCTAGVPYPLIAAARDLLIRTYELPGTKRGLLAVLQDYRTALFAITAESQIDGNAGHATGRDQLVSSDARAAR